MIEFINENLHH